MVHEGIDSISKSGCSHDHHEQGKPLIKRLCLLIGSLFLCRICEFRKQGHPLREPFFCLLQNANTLFCLFRKGNEPLLGLFLLRLGKPFFSRLAHGLHLRKSLLHSRHKSIHLILIFKIALFLTAVIKDDDQIRHRRKQAFSGESAFAHGHAFKDTGDGRYRNIIPPLQIKAVEIERLFSDPARSDLLTVFPVF